MFDVYVEIGKIYTHIKKSNQKINKRIINRQNFKKIIRIKI